MEEAKIASASREVAAPADVVFELIADPAQQPRWDGNDNLDHADAGQRVHSVGDIFLMRLTGGEIRQNHVVEFEEGRRIAWQPSELDKARPGHLWRWEVTPLDDTHSLVTHTYDWTRLTDEKRFARARRTTSERLRASIDRLAEIAESR